MVGNCHHSMPFPSSRLMLAYHQAAGRSQGITRDFSSAAPYSWNCKLRSVHTSGVGYPIAGVG